MTATFLPSSDEVLRPDGAAKALTQARRQESEEGLCSSPQLPGAQGRAPPPVVTVSCGA